ITMMTDKTLDMLREEAEQPPADAASSAATDAAGADSEESDQLGRHGLPEEVFITDEITSKDVHKAVLDELGALDAPHDEANEDEVTQLVDRDKELDAAEDQDDDEITQLVQRDQFFDDGDADA